MFLYSDMVVHDVCEIVVRIKSSWTRDSSHKTWRWILSNSHDRPIAYLTFFIFIARRSNFLLYYSVCITFSGIQTNIWICIQVSIIHVYMYPHLVIIMKVLRTSSIDVLWSLSMINFGIFLFYLFNLRCERKLWGKILVNEIIFSSFCL